MCPFEGRPEGFSAETLEMLDRALQRMWDDMALPGQERRVIPLAGLPPPELRSDKQQPSSLGSRRRRQQQ